MAESTSTELATLSDDFGSNTPVQQEQKSGFLGSMNGGMDIVRQISLIVALTICIALAVLDHFVGA